MKKAIFISFLALIIGSQVMAAGLVPCGGQGENACTFCDFFVMAERIINFLLFTIVPPLAVLFVVIAGAYFILGSGYDPGLVIKGKSILESVAIGLLILYGAWILINLFFTMIGVADWTGLSGGWWKINCGP